MFIQQKMNETMIKNYHKRMKDILESDKTAMYDKI